ncbi:cerebellar degeneration-related protein 2-like isoform X1 [Daphnia pulex]|uniref:cerebellar degeneration-related protein 2-like isoform X1 n=2 Tax=Daphnia pulex TaxID=6669 RepID=UPI001EDD0964|nr:cerebellar degeneration-related protein 2-like isoform X1 [Daphnia pulex]
MSRDEVNKSTANQQQQPNHLPNRLYYDSGQNSMEYWDYSVEIECLKGPQDVEAAAELGRTLLERNRELESTVRQQQAVIDDQTQEMEYLSKQNRLLRQATESRLRLCEQLEASVAECERAKLRLRHQIEAERQRHITLKTNMEAAEERGDELQRLLDASRAAESQSRCQLRLLQQQRHQQQQMLLMQEEEEESHPLEEFTAVMGSSSVHQEHQLQASYCTSSSAASGNNSRRIQMEDTMTVCRLVDDLAEVEERLHLMETDWMEEKRKRMQLETEVMALQQENQRLHEHSASGNNSSHSSSSASIGCDPTSLSPAPASLSLSEELLISSTNDFSSAQWRDAWDNSGPISLIGSGIIANKLCNNEDEELCSDSSSSGFSEENQRSSVAKATQTDLSDLPTICKTIATTTTTTSSSDWADVRSLFREIFAVIQQNI